MPRSAGRLAARKPLGVTRIPGVGEDGAEVGAEGLGGDVGLAHVGAAFDFHACVAGFFERGEEHGEEDAGDGDDDEELDEGEGGLGGDEIGEFGFDIDMFCRCYLLLFAICVICVICVHAFPLAFGSVV